MRPGSLRPFLTFQLLLMKLYYVEVAPNPTKVRLYIAEKIAGGAAISLDEIRVKLIKGEQNEAAHLQRTRFATVPVLEIGPDDYIIESRAIMDYLEDLFPDPCMLGQNPRERAQAREVERITELRVLTPIGRYVHATNSPIGLPKSADIAADASKTLITGLNYVESLLNDGRQFLVGEMPTMADCTLAAALQFARFGNVEVDPRYSCLARWERAYCQREFCKSVLSL